MADDEELVEEQVPIGTIRGWSDLLGIPEEVLRERLAGAPSQQCLAALPDDPEFATVQEGYAAPDVFEACAGLIDKAKADEVVHRLTSGRD